MLHFGEQDPMIPPETIAAHREALPDAKIHLWPGGHTASTATSARTTTRLSRRRPAAHPCLLRNRAEVSPDFELDRRLAQDSPAAGPGSAVAAAADGRPALSLAGAGAAHRRRERMARPRAAAAAAAAARTQRRRGALRAGEPCDKLNIGALGNIVRQLHVHLVARREGDAAWPGRSGARARCSAHPTANACSARASLQALLDRESLAPGAVASARART
jgi:hypothetical protein